MIGLMKIVLVSMLTLTAAVGIIAPVTRHFSSKVTASTMAANEMLERLEGVMGDASVVIDQPIISVRPNCSRQFNNFSLKSREQNVNGTIVIIVHTTTTSFFKKKDTEQVSSMNHLWFSLQYHSSSDYRCQWSGSI
jgi:hypothetical protein